MAALLVADPDQGRAHRLRRSLEVLGHTAWVGHDVDDVRARLSEGDLDLILVDHHVGGGLMAFAELIRTMIDPLPFVMLSSSQSAPTMSARVGAAGLLLRPFSQSELGDLMSRFVRRAAPATLETRRIPAFG